MKKNSFLSYVVRPLSLLAVFVWVFVGGWGSNASRESKLSKNIINISPAQADLTAESASIGLEIGFVGSLGFSGGSAGCSSGSCSSSSSSSCG